ncbi:hypothetical protein AB0E67_02975 [Streptomyces sp. NPDC032161]|uniref:hypothetical protein n=1 Tax=unclassified Streptomyces TaxID=2593676 RepID=UPI0034073621
MSAAFQVPSAPSRRTALHGIGAGAFAPAGPGALGACSSREVTAGKAGAAARAGEADRHRDHPVAVDDRRRGRLVRPHRRHQRVHAPGPEPGATQLLFGLLRWTGTTTPAHRT